ncbi:hypothetical protein KSS87_008933 [Heliosperma pusillum]|nr:hypothetical protein KSS87_008933 [Heliosperma pusillum]
MDKRSGGCVVVSNGVVVVVVECSVGRVVVVVECSVENVVKLLLEKCDGLDNDGNTLLHSAFQPRSTQELALEAYLTYPALRNIRNNKGESPFFLAVSTGYERVVDEIMRIEEPRFHILRRDDGTTVLHCLSSCPESTGKMLLDKYWWMRNLRDDNRKTALDYAKQANAPWLVNLLCKPSLIQKEEFNWLEACKREENIAVFAFVETCEDLQRACRLKNDTPLHHIKLNEYKDYLNFLKNPSVTELKNMTDHDGATALHRALERKDIYFAKALLLDDEVQQNIPDYQDRTPMELLAALCKEHDEWDSLFLVALTNNGEALLAKKASFLVFLLADVYAMCTSMLVLFCLVWSMVSEPDIARVLVDRSVIILMQSLYGTLLAFMTGIYTVIEHSSLWAAIVVFVMCLFIGISATRTILHKVIVFLVPAANREQQDRMRSLEEGHAGASTVEKYSYGVRHVPRLKRNLVSLGMLVDQGYNFQGDGGSLCVGKGSCVIWRGVKEGTIYVLQGTVLTIGASSSRSSVSLESKLGHMQLRMYTSVFVCHRWWLGFRRCFREILAVVEKEWCSAGVDVLGAGGVGEDSVQVCIEKGKILEISGQYRKHQNGDPKARDWKSSHWWEHGFVRRIELPENADWKKTEVTIKNELVLEIKIPMKSFAGSPTHSGGDSE